MYSFPPMHYSVVDATKIASDSSPIYFRTATLLQEKNARTRS